MRLLTTHSSLHTRRWSHSAHAWQRHMSLRLTLGSCCSSRTTVLIWLGGGARLVLNASSVTPNSTSPPQCTSVFNNKRFPSPCEHSLCSHGEGKPAMDAAPIVLSERRRRTRHPKHLFERSLSEIRHHAAAHSPVRIAVREIKFGTTSAQNRTGIPRSQPPNRNRNRNPKP